MGRICALLHVHSAWLRPWVGGKPRLAEQAAISDTLASDTIALSAESHCTELSSAELAWLGYLDENWCFSSDTSLLNIHNFEEGETPRAGYRRPPCPHGLARQPIAVGPRLESGGSLAHRLLRQQTQKHLGTMLGRARLLSLLKKPSIATASPGTEVPRGGGVRPESDGPLPCRCPRSVAVHVATAKYRACASIRTSMSGGTSCATERLQIPGRLYPVRRLAPRVAAYNAGPGNVNRAIRRSGGKRNFWEIRFFLPRGTRNYVPAFMAVAYLMEFPAEHNIFPGDVAPPFAFLDTVMVDEVMRFDQIARCWTLDESTLARLNPMYRMDIVPATERTLATRVTPDGDSGIWPSKTACGSSNPNAHPKSFRSEPVTYRVKSGDVLGRLLTVME